MAASWRLHVVGVVVGLGVTTVVLVGGVVAGLGVASVGGYVVLFFVPQVMGTRPLRLDLLARMVTAALLTVVFAVVAAIGLFDPAVPSASAGLWVASIVFVPVGILALVLDRRRLATAPRR